MADYGIMIGARAIFSLVGMIVIFIGSWIKEKRWDEEGVIAYEKYKGSAADDYPDNVKHDPIQDAYVSITESMVFNDSGAKDLVRVESQDSLDGAPRTLKTEVRAALKVPLVMILGYGLLMLSFIFSPNGGFTVYNAGWNIATIVFLAIIALAVGYGSRVATINRDVDLKKKCFVTIFIFIIWVAIANYADPNVQAPWYFSSFAVFFLCIANSSLRKCRKMGITWDYTGKPNDGIVFNHGSFYFQIVGLYMLWVGMNTTKLAGGETSIPIYTGARAWFIFISGLGIIVPSMIALDYAFECGSKPMSLEIKGNPIPGFAQLSGKAIQEAAKEIQVFNKKVDLSAVAGALETPYVLLFGWFLLAFSCFVQFFAGFKVLNLLIFFSSLVAGIVYALLLPAYWNANQVDFKKLLIIYSVAMIALAIVGGVKGGWSFAFSMISVALILYGQYTDFQEKKRGKYWMQSQEENKNLSVFGMGNSMFVLGWILLCQVLSRP